MKQVSPNVYEHEGIKAEAVVRQSGRPCNGCPFDQYSRPCPLPEKTCTPIIGADRVFRKYKEPKTVNKVKLSDVKFSVIVLDSKRSAILQKAIFAAGGSWSSGGQEVRLTEKMVLTLFCSEITARNDLHSNVSELTLQQALDLLATVEKPEPVFDIKPFDRVLVNQRGKRWSADLFSHLNDDTIICAGTISARIVRYEGNESIIGVICQPSGWWEVRNGKPVWITK